MKYLYYVMKIMESWMILYELEDSMESKDFICSSRTKDMKQFTYWQKFGIDFKYNIN